MIIYLDESGDLGFDFENKNPSEKFIITILMCENRRIARGFRKAIHRIELGVGPR
jgi:hypothetical protein